MSSFKTYQEGNRNPSTKLRLSDSWKFDVVSFENSIW
jgi:hypothetical protein